MISDPYQHKPLPWPKIIGGGAVLWVFNIGLLAVQAPREMHHPIDLAIGVH